MVGIGTSDGICLCESLVIGYRPCGCGHDPFLDGVGGGIEEHLGKGCSGVEDEAGVEVIYDSLHIC